MRGAAAAFQFGRSLGLAAVAAAALGVHAAHLFLHRQERSRDCLCYPSGGDATERQADGARGEPRLLSAHRHCLVCEFLASVNPAAPEATVPQPTLEPSGAARARGGRTEPPVCALCGCSPRAPPVDAAC